MKFMCKKKYSKKEKIAGGDIIVLKPYFSGETKSYRNLERLNGRKTVWVAELPKKSFQDVYVSFDIKDGRLFANTFKCMYCEISLTDGKVISEEFTK